ncbi:UPF0481 protein [Actinidia chinensis var. chinensis]|uniref:UPF0481 protein n=1 Tax=Actinidia chinensis var. chinensis TaxID=1590841 RepID=A0A2R6RWP6_ACTCC|nr:UPF0481 protein [Actinidia chinensis var. chinensis]
MAADQSETDLIQEMEKITSALGSKLTGLPSPGSFRGWSIYKVPKRLRKLNEEAYTPKLVSIGPVHHGQPHLNSMERYKLEYCKKFLDITLVSLKEVIKRAIECEAAVRSQYQDTVEFSRKEFVEMIALDGLFIIMLFLKEMFRRTFDSNDVIFVDNWMLRELFHDTMLLENQLPSFFLDYLLKMVPQELRNTTFSELTRHYFMNVGNADRVAIDEPKRHLVEYLQTFHLTMPKEDLVEYFQTFHGMSPISLDREVYRKKIFEYTRSATELHAAGIQFRSSPDPCILKIEFTEYGELIIPQLKVNEWTETLFRNLIAFEQCDHQPEYISSYIIFLDCLINTPMDVDLLVECGIIENSLGDSERVSNLFNNLYKETFTEYSIFYYTDIGRKLNAYNKDYWHRWRAARYRWNVILKRDYFSNPWSGISVIAAIILLILTVVQTVCSILGL